MNTRITKCLTMIMVAAVIAEGAIAAEASPATAAAGSTADPAAQDSNAEVAEITVTAQRRSENLQRVPVTVSAFSADALAKVGVEDMQGITDVVPGFNFQSVQGWSTPRLRGIGSAAAGPGIESQVAVYVDDVYYASSPGSLFTFNNIDQVSVLKGPQGTLFGRNAVAGLLQITTRDPDQTPTLRVSAGYGNYDTTKASIYASGGIAPGVAMDFAAVGTTMGEGYGRNLFNGEDARRTNHDFELRSKLVATPSDQDKITLIFDYSEISGSQGVIRLEPGTTPAAGTGPAYGGSVWDSDANGSNFLNVRSEGVSAKYVHEFPYFKFQSITAGRQLWYDNSLDLDVTATPYQEIDQVQQDRQFSQELQIQSLGSGNFDWTAGLYYFDLTSKYLPLNLELPGGAGIDPSYPVDSIQTVGETEGKSVAGYGQMSYKFTPTTTITAGGRVTWEHRSLSAEQFISFDLGIPTVNIPFPKVDTTVERPTYRLSLDQDLGGDVLAYLSYNRGFKSGGYDVGAPGSPAYKPETLDAYEFGIKSTLFNRKITLNGAAFYYDYSDIQVQYIRADGSIGIINGATAYPKGLEAAMTAAITSALSASISAIYEDAKFGSFPLAPISTPAGGVPVVFGDISGHQMPVTSKFTATVGGNYRVALAGGNLDISGVVNHSDGWYTEPDNAIRQPAFNRVNGTIKWTSPADKYNVTLWGDNLTSAEVRSNATTLAIGTHVVSFDPPRTYGVTFGYNF